jgi:hypothetical protein
MPSVAERLLSFKVLKLPSQAAPSRLDLAVKIARIFPIPIESQAPCEPKLGGKRAGQPEWHAS